MKVQRIKSVVLVNYQDICFKSTRVSHNSGWSSFHSSGVLHRPYSQFYDCDVNGRAEKRRCHMSSISMVVTSEVKINVLTKEGDKVGPLTDLCFVMYAELESCTVSACLHVACSTRNSLNTRLTQSALVSVRTVFENVVS